ncbi:MAG: trypsin-like peptidase domain-containing protein [Planctomycetes bacterium]|jgi:S1-C subfamily serine protease|nr:trypsin-like peptidase domain-containing protein [Planctomycetota bacterium]
MSPRHALLVLLSFTTAFAGEDARREQLKAELRQASAELARFSRAVNLVHELVAPSVVSIHTREERLRPILYRGRLFAEKREVEVGEGSGFVFHSDATASWILTNAHVVLQTNAEQQFVTGRNGQPIGYDRIAVVLNDQRELKAEYVGVYPESDLAVLKVEVPALPTLDWADSDQAKVGDWVVALGFPLGVGYSATSGIVSATDRSIGSRMGLGGFDSFIQTDAAINPGNSGGPLVDVNGRVLGINASIRSSTGANIGLGFAIPANLGRRIADDLRQYGRVRRPMVGVNLDDITPENAQKLGLAQTQAVQVTGVVPGGPAATAGLEPGDIILTINQTRIASLQQFQARVASSILGQPLTLRIWRQGKEGERTVTPIAEDDLRGKLEAAAAATAAKQGVALPGFGLALASDDQAGLVITRIEPAGVAAGAGLKPGDRLLHERSHGQLTTTNDASALANRRELIVQVYQGGRSFWLRLQR